MYPSTFSISNQSLKTTTLPIVWKSRSKYQKPLPEMDDCLIPSIKSSVSHIGSLECHENQL